MSHRFNFCFLGCIAIFAWLVGCGAKQTIIQGPPPAVFVVLGDTRPVGTGAQPYPFHQIADMAAREKPLAVFHTGDVIDGYGLTKNDAIQSYKEFKEVASKFGAPVYVSPGNHDVFDAISKKLFEEQIGPLYQTLELSGCVFIILNTETPGASMRLDDKQYAWLERELKKHFQAARQVFVVMHRPLWPTGEHVGDSLDAWPEHRDYLVRLFKKYGVKYVFVGHEHIFSKIERDGIVQFTTGGGGAPLETGREQGGYHHYLRVVVTGPFPETEDAPARPVEVKVQVVKVSDPVSVALENIREGEPVLSFDIIKRARGMPKLQNHPDVRIVTALTHMAIGELGTGRDIIGEVITERPGSALTAGKMLLHLGWAQEAAGAFMMGIKRRPKDALLYEAMADAWFALGDKPKAVKYLLSATRLNKRYANPYYRLMVYYLSEERMEDAKKAAAGFVKIRPFGKRAAQALKLLGRRLPSPPPPPGSSGRGR